MKAKVAEYEATAKEEKRKRIVDQVEKFVAQGKIKADQKDKWTAKIVADETLIEDISNLPVNRAANKITLIGGQVGTQVDAGLTNVVANTMHEIRHNLNNK